MTTPNVPAACFAWRRAPFGDAPEISVVIPMHNEEGGAAALVAEIAGALAGRAFEILAVDDASTDSTKARLIEERAKNGGLRVLAHARNAGQSRALRTGILAARAPVIVTLDGDGQNDPADILALIDRLTRHDAPQTLAMVGGERVARQDKAARRWASQIANGVRARLLRDSARDTGCGLKAFYREAFLRLPAFDHMHRYLPALMRREGFTIEFVPVRHRPRLHGRSKYTNLQRLAVAFRDLLGVMWLRDRARSPETISEL
jgi:glycosyltransferase involved in cell wall biosynthesis